VRLRRRRPVKRRRGGLIEAAVAARHDVERDCFLFGDAAGDRVKLLLAEQGIPERRFK
jgi:hypothetical protein